MYWVPLQCIGARNVISWCTLGRFLLGFRGIFAKTDLAGLLIWWNQSGPVVQPLSKSDWADFSGIFANFVQFKLNLIFDNILAANNL
jgi:hypothetical protein